MNKPEPIGDEEVMYEGRIFEVVQQPHQIGDRVINFESARRAPGVRLMIVHDGKMLITKEYRSELNGFDYRLPGGKVFDSLNEFQEARKLGKEMVEEAKLAAQREALEETGHVVEKMQHIHTTSPGATVSWDLYYFLIEDAHEHEDGQQLEDGEVITAMWKSFDEVKAMCLSGEIQEERSVAVLLKYLMS